MTVSWTPRPLFYSWRGSSVLWFFANGGFTNGTDAVSSVSVELVDRWRMRQWRMHAPHVGAGTGTGTAAAMPATNAITPEALVPEKTDLVSISLPLQWNTGHPPLCQSSVPSSWTVPLHRVRFPHPGPPKNAVLGPEMPSPQRQTTNPAPVRATYSTH